ncbi:MAG: hypothetical protein H6577_07320 [Lewinellaceae bacterium]|nr:hypothetical protein [Saprospiraceae bacterium]MCB9337921.1 hypothetical protein [Lewinellaceae bacterium]
MDCKIKNWKDKAVQRRIEIWSKEKRIRELIESRDKWKAKYKAKLAEN